MGGPVGSILGTAGSIALGTNPFAAVGSTLATNALLGGGGSSSDPNVGGGTTPVYAQPDFNYGANTYTLNNKPYDASKYFITGDKGVYNLLPMLSDPYKDPNKTDFVTGSYNTYKTIYDKMADDAAAQAAFNKLYAPQTYTYTPPVAKTKGSNYVSRGYGNDSNNSSILSGSLNLNDPYATNNTGRDTTGGYSSDNNQTAGMGSYNPSTGVGTSQAGMGSYNSSGVGTSQYGMGSIANRSDIFGMNTLPKGLPGTVRQDLVQAIKNQQQAAGKYYNPHAEYKGQNITPPTTPYTYAPIQYVNWNLDPTARRFAGYAAENKNPFFVPFAPKPATTTTTPNAPVNPVGSLTNPGQYQPVNVRKGGIIGLLRN